MESFDAFQDKEFEQLNEAILKAIVSSREVEEVLQDFKSKDLINEMAVVNLILSLDELSDLIFSKPSAKDLYKLEPAMGKQQASDSENKPASAPRKNHLVDGKNLSRNEILFERYYQGKFNEKQWLKRVKIKI